MPGHRAISPLALVGMAPEGMRVTALALNVLVATIGTVSYMRAGHFDWRTFYPFVILSIPAAFIGGVIHLPPEIYKPAVGVSLGVRRTRLPLPKLATAAHQECRLHRVSWLAVRLACSPA